MFGLKWFWAYEEVMHSHKPALEGEYWQHLEERLCDLNPCF